MNRRAEGIRSGCRQGRTCCPVRRVVHCCAGHRAKDGHLFCPSGDNERLIGVGQRRLRQIESNPQPPVRPASDGAQGDLRGLRCLRRPVGVGHEGSSPCGLLFSFGFTLGMRNCFLCPADFRGHEAFLDLKRGSQVAKNGPRPLIFPKAAVHVAKSTQSRADIPDAASFCDLGRTKAELVHPFHNERFDRQRVRAHASPLLRHDPELASFRRYRTNQNVAAMARTLSILPRA